MVCVEKENFGSYIERGFFVNGDISDEFYVLGPLDGFELVNEIKK